MMKAIGNKKKTEGKGDAYFREQAGQCSNDIKITSVEATNLTYLTY